MSSTNKSNPIVLADFSLRQAHLELRTTPKLLHWDRAGVIWSETLAKIPRLTLVQGDPNKTAFSLDNKHILSIFLDNSGTTPHTTILGTTHNPHKSLKDFGELLKTFIDIVEERLEITDYFRIGLRCIYSKNYPDRDAASQAFFSTNLFNVSEGPFFGIKGFPILPEYSVRWEDGKSGVSIRLRVESFKYEFTPPPDWQEVEPVSKQSNRLTYDVDYYTMGTISVWQFNIVEWINQVVHRLNRDTDKFLRGA